MAGAPLKGRPIVCVPRRAVGRTQVNGLQAITGLVACSYPYTHNITVDASASPISDRASLGLDEGRAQRCMDS